jgi:dCTP deaminase
MEKIVILAKPEILYEIDNKNILISPFDASSIGPASVDLSLDNSIREFLPEKYVFDNDIDYKKVTKIININNGYLLYPCKLVLAITKEKITLPDNICGWINSRSRYARIGLMSHTSSPFVMPGVSNKQVLEIFNAGPFPINLKTGDKICHIVFQRCSGGASYEGAYKNQAL